jgi:hypothetical protein
LASFATLNVRENSDPAHATALPCRPFDAENPRNRTKLLAARARAFHDASQEDFIDKLKWFAYYPIATLNRVGNFSNGAISLKFKTIARGLEPTARAILRNIVQPA